jgi:DNA-binding MarR family transcriptional regulator
MESSGHVTRSPDPDDGRVQRLCATPSGKRLHAQIRRELLSRQRSLISDLPDDSRCAAVIVLRRLAERAARIFGSDADERR